MLKAFSLPSFVAAVLLCGCSDSKVASDGNIRSALKSYLKDDGALCLGLATWPVIVEPDDLKMVQRFPSSIAGQMQVLETAGLVASENVVLKGADIGGSNIVKTYQLTDLGRKFYRQWPQDHKFHPNGADVCFADRALNQLIKWEPAQSGLGQEVVATYRYDVVDIADWAKTAAFKVAFKDIAARAFNAMPEQRNVVLVDSGWQVKP